MREMLQCTIDRQILGQQKMCGFEFPTNRRRHSTSITSHLVQNAMSCALDAIRNPVVRVQCQTLHRRCNFNDEISTRMKLICECQVKQQMPTTNSFVSHTHRPTQLLRRCGGCCCLLIIIMECMMHQWNLVASVIARASLYTESANYCIHG